MKFSFLRLAILLGLIILVIRLVRGDVPDRRIILPSKPVVTPEIRHGGSWYMAADGHAVYCYGPTRMIPDVNGFKKVVLFCRGNRSIVELKD